MRLRLHRSLSILLLLTAPALLPAGAQVKGRSLQPLQRTVVFVWPSTLRVVEATPIRVVPGDLVVLEIPPEEATRDRKVVYNCHWEEKKKRRGGFLNLSTEEYTEEQKRNVPVQLQLGQQIRVAVKIPGNDPQQLVQEKPSLSKVAYEPGEISIAATVSTALPQKPDSRAVCSPTPLPSGEAWYRVSVRITRFQ